MTYWSRISRISCGLGKSDFDKPASEPVPAASSRIMSLHRSMHSSQMNTDGPAISFFTSCWLLPQKEQYRSFSPLEDFLSDMVQFSYVCKKDKSGAQGPSPSSMLPEIKTKRPNVVAPGRFFRLTVV